MSGASERANGQASGPVCFLVVLDHSGIEENPVDNRKKNKIHNNSPNLCFMANSVRSISHSSGSGESPKMVGLDLFGAG